MIRQLGRLFRKGGTSSPSSTGMPKLTLFNQSMLPEELRLPLPADPMSRICAGLVDLSLCAACGVGLAAASHYGMGLEALSASGLGQGAGLVLWAARDGLGPGGNRSPGKAMLGLELVTSDGTLVSPMAALCRSSYFLLLPATPLHPFVGLTLEVLLFWDLATLLFTQDSRKAGDYMWGSRVVEELPGRDLRVLDYREAQEIEELRMKLEKVAPGWLEEEGLLRDTHWFIPRVNEKKSVLAGEKLRPQLDHSTTYSIRKEKK